MTTPQASTLLDMPCGQKLRVMSLTGEPPVRSRLCSLGILPGTEIEVCQAHPGKGSIRVRVRESSLVLGQSMAESVECECVLADKEIQHHDGCCGKHHGGEKVHGHKHGHACKNSHGGGCCGRHAGLSPAS